VYYAGHAAWGALQTRGACSHPSPLGHWPCPSFMNHVHRRVGARWGSPAIGLHFLLSGKTCSVCDVIKQACVYKCWWELLLASLFRGRDPVAEERGLSHTGTPLPPGSGKATGSKSCTVESFLGKWVEATVGKSDLKC
jgi:hypothetical protein